ncbi:MAG: multi-sensor signal transduction histidine kinase [Pedosphaera sp.]|nr:multi-sensor signal transduction histidine kinase [Pedosphaera sp.]
MDNDIASFIGFANKPEVSPFVVRVKAQVWNYVLATFCLGAATFLRWLLDPYLGSSVPFGVMALAIIFVAWHGGLGPSLYTVIAGYLVTAFWFVSPRHSVMISGFPALGVTITYFCVGFAITFMAHVQRLAQARARASEQLALRRLSELETLYEQAPIGLCFTDADHRYVRINEELAILGGRSVSDHIGRTVWEMVPDLADKLRPMFENVLKTGKPMHAIEVHGTLPCSNSSERCWLASYHPVKDAKGVVLGINTTMLEITERKRAEEALRRSEEKYRSLYKSTPVMMHSIDSECRLLSVSNYWLEHLGFTWEEVIARKSTDFLTPESRKLAQESVLPEYFKTGVCKDVPYQFVKKNGEVIDVLLSAIAERDCNGNLVRSLAVLVDVTAQKRAEEQIRQHSRELERRVRERTAELEAFCYSVSHDLRSPLRSIMSFTQILSDQHQLHFDEESREMVQYIIQSAQRMDRLIHDLLALSRLSHANMARQSVDLSAVVGKIVAGIRQSDPTRAVDFVVAPNLMAMGDKGLLQIALENLLNNAWKFTARCDHGRIEFGIELQPDCKKTYFVRDNGAGFDMAYAGKLFGVFERLHNSAEFPGTGIGLAIVRRIIERHGGSVWATGAVNQGATFYFTLQD